MYEGQDGQITYVSFFRQILKNGSVGVADVAVAEGVNPSLTILQAVISKAHDFIDSTQVWHHNSDFDADIGRLLSIIQSTALTTAKRQKEDGLSQLET